MQRRLVQIIQLVGAVALAHTAGIVGAFFTVTDQSSWYMLLNKPVGTPPGWVFPIVWSTLYTLIGIALYRIVRKRNVASGARRWIIVFAVQLILNALWTILFFGLEHPVLALGEICLLLVSIVVLIKQALPIDKGAAMLLVPYVAWVAYATYLALGIVVLN